MSTKERRKSPSARVLALLLPIAAAAILFTDCGNNANTADPIETVKIGAATAVAGLAYIADDQGFFKQRGIKVTLKSFDAGTSAVDALLAGEVDVATASEFVVVRKSFDNSTLRAFAQVASSNLMELVTRKDRGIKRLSDLKGKKIGLPRGTISEFSLGSYLRNNGLALSSVRIVDIPPSTAEEVLAAGSVDGVVIWGPYAARLKERLGENAVMWPVQGRTDYYVLLVSNEVFLRRWPVAAEKILRALVDAEAFAERRPREARQILESRLKLRPEDARLFLEKSMLQVRLDQGLLALMEEEARWMIRNGLTPRKEVPNYLDTVYPKALDAVKPDAVGIIH